jgi:hypothetical protein
VHSDRRGDQHTERRPVAEGDADSDPLRERMQCHHADDHQRAERIGAAQRAKLDVAVMSQ